MSVTTLNRDEFRKFAKGDFVEKEVAGGIALNAIKGEDMDKYANGAVMAFDEFKKPEKAYEITKRKVDEIARNAIAGQDVSPPSRL